jgi:hypothetical protein
LGTFWLKIEQFWPFEEIYIFSNVGHLRYRTALTDTILKGTHPGTIPARFGLIWFSGFRGKDLNVIFYQNMPNLHNRNKLAERKISQISQGFQSGPVPGTFTRLRSCIVPAEITEPPKISGGENHKYDDR